MAEIDKKIKLLKDYFEKRDDILMAFVFGSFAKGKETAKSDFDVAVYFKPENGRVEVEKGVFYKDEHVVWNDIERIIKRNTDMAVLNRVPAGLAYSAVQNGKPIIIKDRFIYIDFILRTGSRAFDFRDFVRDFLAIKARSHSLSLEDKDRLIKIINFLEGELSDFEEYKALDFKTYESDRKKKRSAERWVENIVNASIDIAKILLASEKRRLPDTYADTLHLLAALPDFKEETAEKIASFVDLRNLLSHEYLDLRFSQIQNFIKNAEPLYKELVNYTDTFLKRS